MEMQMLSLKHTMKRLIATYGLFSVVYLVQSTEHRKNERKKEKKIIKKESNGLKTEGTCMDDLCLSH